MKFDLSLAAITAFEQLKAAFTSNTLLAQFNPNVASVMETDALDFVAAGVLS